MYVVLDQVYKIKTQHNPISLRCGVSKMYICPSAFLWLRLAAVLRLYFPQNLASHQKDNILTEYSATSTTHAQAALMLWSAPLLAFPGMI